MRAQVLCQKGCERFPGYPTGFLVLSRCYESQGMWEQARIALDQGLRLDPANPAGFRRLSRIYRQLGNDTLARKCLERALEQDPLSEGITAELRAATRLPAQQSGIDAGDIRAEPVRGQTAPAQPALSKPTEMNPSEEEVIAASLEESDLAEDEGLFDTEAIVEIPSIPGLAAAAHKIARSGEEFSETPAKVEKSGNIPATADEAFGQVRPLPEWKQEPDPLGPKAQEPEHAGESSAREEIPATDVGNGVGDVDEDVAESDSAFALGGNEISTQGAGLFDNDAVAEPTTPTVNERRTETAVASPPRVEEIDGLGALMAETEPPAKVGEVENREAVSRFRSSDGLTEIFEEVHSAEPVDRVAFKGYTEPRPPVATNTLAQLYEDQGFRNEARRTYQEVLENDPSNESARVGLERLGNEPDTRTIDG
ncbi:MAG: tetratricopeptide repeat protein [Candidatus Latescibacterota bacterium]|nr:tetratricopeptide repeat protein [Candidatus Latescibacterota bacterium]